MPLMRKERDLQPKYERKIYFRSALHSCNNSGLRSGSQCSHPASMDTSHASPLHLDPRPLMNQNNRAWRTVFKIASRAKRLKFCLTSHTHLTSCQLTTNSSSIWTTFLQEKCFRNPGKQDAESAFQEFIKS